MRVIYWVRGAEYERLMELSAASVEKVYAKAVIEVERDDGERPAMVANLDAQLKALYRAKEGEPVLFLDVDTLLRKPFPFDHEADLYVTWRDHVGFSNGEKVSGVAELMPYNYGVLGCRASLKTLEAFTWMRAQVLKMSAAHQGWYGNQLALAALVGSRPDQGTGTKTTRIRWSPTDSGVTELTVKQLPCAEWNFTPDTDSEDVTGKGVIHLKGNRKDLMQHYARVA